MIRAGCSSGLMAITSRTDQIRLDVLIDRLQAGVVRINQRYQRSGQIWPGRAKSFLVETVIRGMPIPRVLLHDVPNPTAPHQSDIIDGQQRCTILADYKNNRFSLTADVDGERLHGKKYSDLSAHDQAAFDSYSIPLDRYSGVTPKDIRQVFRRLNFYTAPLNAAEQRHAQFYGELSRFVEEHAERWRTLTEEMRIFTVKQLRRRAHEQFMAEVVDAMLNGISTPSAKTLRRTYHDNEREFSSAQDFGRKLEAARARIATYSFIRGTKLKKHYQLFSLVLALIQCEADMQSLRGDLGGLRTLREPDDVRRGLTPLDNAIRNRVEHGKYARFWQASHEKTNVRENRLIRTRYFIEAIAEPDRA
jgi:hypothetical protein